MQGLTNQEVQKRIDNGQINKEVQSKTKPTKQILLQNTINYFNILNIILACIILFSGQIKNILFLGVIILNTGIAIFQELRSKKMVEKLTLLSKNKIEVIRETRTLLSPNEIVVDDLVVLKTGDQVPVDSVIIEGSLEMDESNLTGESLTIFKSKDDFIYSGSIVTSGSAIVRVKNVGENNYMHQILSQTKVTTLHPSQLRDTMNQILKIVTIGIIPVGILLFLKNHFIFRLPFEEVILKSTAPLIGMIPEGLILLTSVTLAVAVFTLGLKQILVQELYCVETLARVNVLCVDKTGTITTQQMQVEKVIGDLDKIMPMYLNTFDFANASEQALIQYFGKQEGDEVLYKIPFSSKRKYSAVSFKKYGTYIVGAYEFIIKQPLAEHQTIMQTFMQQGLRVLTVAKSEYGIVDEYLPEHLEVVGFIVLSDVLREDTDKIFAYFKSQEIAIKIISGDHPLAVAAIAKKAGLEDIEAIDVSQLDEKQLIEKMQTANIFGRVTPEQKKWMTTYFQSQNKTVAMTGDGVNDVLALKQADVSIAMAQGCDAAKQISNIVLLENNFKNLYDILMEGRRVINNIQRVATLFLSKTFISMIMALVSILGNFAFPFIPIQFTLISAVTIGIPAFILTLEKNTQQIQSHFMLHVIKRALLSALMFTVGTISLSFFFQSNLSTIATLFAIGNGFVLIYIVSKPFNRLKALLIFAMLLIVVLIHFWARTFFALDILSVFEYVLILLLTSLSLFIQSFIYKKYDF